MYRRFNKQFEMFQVLSILSTFLILMIGGSPSDADLNGTDFKCTGRSYHNVTLTAYYPDYTSDDEIDYLDIRGKKLKTLQDYIDGRETYVSASMDLIGTGLKYGSNLCIPELNEHFGRRIPLQARDYDSNIKERKFTRVDICVRTDVDSYDKAVNRLVTLYV
ncbi:uncharacterized protein LOC118445208 [Vespa mandarinia]|uniref:uncharacterized protein LOC118445208 n=1 Tax=Vespa mandarinia TaxID=7446 RepID=UPI0016193187|nr:uncharacterized protein LOC118445208 [Vespa mandarinia]XP_047367301.1 uncharacterized protein LOC124956020 isoform X1 [Vespa velutina]